MQDTIPIKSPNFWTRIKTYSREMFPVPAYLPYIIVLYGCLNFTSQAISSGSIIIDSYFLVGMVTAFFIMLQMRTFDDLKDWEIDKILFPERATPRNAVLKSDIQFLAIASILISTTINLLLGQQTLIVFTGMMIYSFLTYKWFFAEQFHRQHLLFTMATHQPLPWAINYFLIHTALASGTDYDPFSKNQWILLAIFSLPVTAWEVSRKIRALGHETAYETFSMIFGTRPATLIPFTALSLCGILSVYISHILSLGTSYTLICLALFIYLTILYGRFYLFPTVKNNVLKNTAMIYTTLLFLNLLIHILLKYKLIFTL